MKIERNDSSIITKESFTLPHKTSVKSVKEGCASKKLSSIFTVVTDLKNQGVTLPFSRNSHDSQHSHSELNQLNSDAQKLDFDHPSFELPLKWLKNALLEGHIEITQPQYGNLIGWPHRPLRAQSLFIDFDLWCTKLGETHKNRIAFLELLDTIFTRAGNSYHFPPLDICRKRFKNLPLVRGNQ